MGVIGFSIRAWWEEKQAEGAAVDERIHLESATKGQYKLFHNTYLRNWFRFSGWLSAWLCDFSYPVYQLFPGEFFYRWYLIWADICLVVLSIQNLSLSSFHTKIWTSGSWEEIWGWYLYCRLLNSKFEYVSLTNFRELKTDAGRIFRSDPGRLRGGWVEWTGYSKWTLMLYKSCMPNNAEN